MTSRDMSRRTLLKTAALLRGRRYQRAAAERRSQVCRKPLPLIGRNWLPRLLRK